MPYVGSSGALQEERSVFTISYLRDSVVWFLSMLVLFAQSLIDPEVRLSSSPAPSRAYRSSGSRRGGGGGGGSSGGSGGSSGGRYGMPRGSNIRGLRPQGECSNPMPGGGG